MSDEARTYLSEALDLMQRHSLRRDEVDWVKLRADAFAYVAGARTPADTHRALRAALGALDRHSRFLDPVQVATPASELLGPATFPGPEGRLLAGGIGYLTLPGTPAGDDAAARRYLDQGRDALVQLDSGRPCGWIIDLRLNGGGNMWPMLGVVAPLIGDGIVGHFVFPDGERRPWSISRGRALLGDEALSPPIEPYTLTSQPGPIAVLTGRITGSAGEAVLISFLGRPDTRTFGMETFGVPTANNGHLLSDGAMLVIAEAYEADRTGRVHRAAIQPDQRVPFRQAAVGASTDPAMLAARAWLGEQPACR